MSYREFPLQNLAALLRPQPRHPHVCPLAFHSLILFHAEDPAGPSSSADVITEDEALDDPQPLRPLTSLNWPYVPEESAYPDPLKRDDPRPLQLHQYEAIGMSVQSTPISHV